MLPEEHNRSVFDSGANIDGVGITMNILVYLSNCQLNYMGYVINQATWEDIDTVYDDDDL